VSALALFVAVLLIAGNAFFVGAEFALISSRRSSIESIAAGGNRRARLVLDDLRPLPLMLAGCQLGVTVCSLTLGAVSEPALAHLFEGWLDAVRAPDWLLHPISFTVALVLIVGLHTVLGEMVPKNIAIARPEGSVLVLGPPLAVVVRLLRPVIWLLNRLTKMTLRAVGVEARDEVNSAFTAEEIAALIGESRAQGLLDPSEHDLMSHALELGERTAAAVALALDTLVTVPETVVADDVEELVAATGYSRFPVRRGPANAPDDPIIGFVHAKDTLGLGAEERRQPLPPRRMRPLVPIPAAMPLAEVLASLQRAGSHLGLVVDRDGTALGVIALEDVVEEFVGEIDDASHQLLESTPAPGRTAGGTGGQGRRA
jgi:CBS domain containing-hemolysin-like protein